MAGGNVVDSRPHVDHTYRDFSRFLENGGKVPIHKKSGNNFPAELHRLLSDPSNSHIITWMPHGRAWKILEEELLMSTVVPAYFGQKKFQSFNRQLNAWGFKRLHQQGADAGCYYHQCFLHGLPKLTPLMKRDTDRGAKRPHAEGEPNFNLISSSYPLPPMSSAQDSSHLASSESFARDVSSYQASERGNAQNPTFNSTRGGTTDAERCPTSYETSDGKDKQRPMLPSAQDTSSAMSAVASTPSSARNVHFSDTRDSATSSFVSTELTSARVHRPTPNRLPGMADQQHLRSHERDQYENPHWVQESSTSQFTTTLSTSLFTVTAGAPTHMSYPHSYRTTHSFQNPAIHEHWAHEHWTTLSTNAAGDPAQNTPTTFTPSPLARAGSTTTPSSTLTSTNNPQQSDQAHMKPPHQDGSASSSNLGMPTPHPQHHYLIEPLQLGPDFDQDISFNDDAKAFLENLLPPSPNGASS